MSDQPENLNAGLEDTENAEDTDNAYDGDLGDGARKRGSSAGIIGLGSCI